MLNKILEPENSDFEKNIHMINFVFQDNKQINKLKHITPFHLKDLLTKEQSEIKNPFENSIFYEIDNSYNKNEATDRFNSKRLKEVN